MNRKFNESGRTMLEMMGVLAIMGVIMYGAIVSIGFGVDMYKVTATYNDLEQAAGDLKDIYSWRRDGYPKENLAYFLCQEGLDPMKAEDNCGTKTHAEFSSRWTGVDININGDEDTDDGGSFFLIRLTQLSSFACRRLEGMKWNQLYVCYDEDDSDNHKKGCHTSNPGDTTDCDKGVLTLRPS